MKAGRLRQTGTLERQSAGPENDFGHRPDVWTSLAANIRASIEPIRGREFMTASGEHAELTHRIRIRHSSSTATARPRDRFVSAGVVYEIQSAINTDMRNREIQLMCKQVIND